MVVFLTGSVVQILGFAFTPLQHFLMPRFGWGGLMMCLNAAIFLGMWLKTPTRRLLSVAAGMCVFLASMESVQLYWKGTVPVVSNPFHDRLHSSWAWSVAPLLVSAVILVWLARSQRDESVDDSVTAK